MTDAFVCDPIRTAFGRLGGGLCRLRADELAAEPLRALKGRLPRMDWEAVDDVILGGANQAGEDNRNVARMAWLLAELPESVSGVTVNRLCGSGMEAVAQAARLVRSGEAQVVVAGGSESMSRAPFVLAKADTPYSRRVEMYDTTLGWRFVNPSMEARYGIDSMPETAENVAATFQISREDQDAFALRSQQRAARAQAEGRFLSEIATVRVPEPKQEPRSFEVDEHPRPHTSLENLARLPTPFRAGGTVTAGNSSGLNDGAAALLVASEDAVRKFELHPLARVVASATAGVPPRVMGLGPVPAVRKLLQRTSLSVEALDIVELNEAFAAQALAVLRELGVPEDAPYVNPNGGAIALGHPLGASGARLVQTAALQLNLQKVTRALTSMCIGVGQGIALLLERV